MQYQNQQLRNVQRNQAGFIALIALLIVAAAGLTIGIAVSLSGIEEIQVSFSNSQAAKARAAAIGCLEQGLERLRYDWSSYSGSLSIGDASCIMDTVVNGNQATVSAIGTFGIYYQKATATLDDNLNVISWQEY